MAALARAVLGFSDLSFLATADWGGLPVWPWKTPGQIRVAKGMGHIAERQSSKFVLSLGDHFYFHGVLSADDRRWKQTFDQVYAARSLQGAGFWRVVGGNHDHAGNVSAQLAYAARAGSRWHYPALQYRWREVLDDESGTSIDFVMIDTVLLCGMPGRRPKPGASARWAWVERALAASQADFLVVGGHYPVHSPSSHGPSRCLQTKLEPLLQRASASVYLSGHDHCLFHAGAAGSTQFHGVGAGFTASRSQKNRRTMTKRAPLRFFFGGRGRLHVLTGGFAAVSVSAAGLTVTHYDDQGKALHSSTVPPRATAGHGDSGKDGGTSCLADEGMETWRASNSCATVAGAGAVPFTT